MRVTIYIPIIIYISGDVGEESIEMFVLGEGLLAEVLQKHLEFLYLGVDRSGAQVHVDAENRHC